jgi:hypothetical protein
VNDDIKVASLLVKKVKNPTERSCTSGGQVLINPFLKKQASKLVPGPEFGPVYSPHFLKLPCRYLQWPLGTC